MAAWLGIVDSESNAAKPADTFAITRINIVFQPVKSGE